MKPSESVTGSGKIFMICVFFVWLLGMFYLHFPGDATRDTYAQLAQGVIGEYTNWKPAL